MTPSPPRIVPVSRGTHGNRRWRRLRNYAFAARDAIAPLVAAEAATACIALPMGFIKVGEEFRLVALLGLAPGRNLFVAPDGRWIGSYVPACFRTYPFRFANAPQGQPVLCVVEDQDFVVDGPEGEPFFDGEEGTTPAPAIREVMEVLQKILASASLTVAATAALARHGLIVPWALKAPGPDGGQALEGLYRIDESALNVLPAAGLAELRDCGALALAYTQLLSQQNVTVLGTLADAHKKLEAARTAAAQQIVTPTGELNLEFLNTNNTLDFRGLG